MRLWYSLSKRHSAGLRRNVAVCGILVAKIGNRPFGTDTSDLTRIWLNCEDHSALSGPDTKSAPPTLSFGTMRLSLASG